jgi:hypothetical protein
LPHSNAILTRLPAPLHLPSFLEFGEVPSDFAIFGVLGDESEGFEGVEAVINLRFAAGGVFELGGDRFHGPFSALGAQEVPDGGELVFEVFGPFLLGGGGGDWGFDRGDAFEFALGGLDLIRGLIVRAEPADVAVAFFLGALGVEFD